MRKKGETYGTSQHEDRNVERKNLDYRRDAREFAKGDGEDFIVRSKCQ